MPSGRFAVSMFGLWCPYQSCLPAFWLAGYVPVCSHYFELGTFQGTVKEHTTCE